MNRRNALRILGSMCVCLLGKPAVVYAELLKGNNITFNTDFATDFTLCETGIRNIIIQKRDGTKLIIPFCEIVKALTE